jgi:hypothetical protein
MNRIERMQRIVTDASRADAYRRLEAQIANGAEGPLTDDEVLSLLISLKREVDIQARTFVWRLLCRSKRKDEVRDFALASLAKKSDNHRGLALLYLRLHYPELMPVLAQRYQNDVDPEVVYELTEYVGTSNPERAVDMKIELLPCESHELSDALEIEISQLGNRRHLNELRRRDQAAGGKTIFGRIANLLAERLSDASR